MSCSNLESIDPGDLGILFSSTGQVSVREKNIPKFSANVFLVMSVFHKKVDSLFSRTALVPVRENNDLPFQMLAEHARKVLKLSQETANIFQCF